MFGGQVVGAFGHCGRSNFRHSKIHLLFLTTIQNLTNESCKSSVETNRPVHGTDIVNVKVSYFYDKRDMTEDSSLNLIFLSDAVKYRY